MIKVPESGLNLFVRSVLAKAGVDQFSCDAVAQSLVDANLRGIDTHGVRLLPIYLNNLEQGGIEKEPRMEVKRTYPSCCVVDADDGFGAAAGFRAIDECMKIAEEQGMAVATVINSSHCGYMAAFCLRAAEKGFMAFGFTNNGPIMLSHNGTAEYFGTNPICFAAPREEGAPFCVDMATTGKTNNSVQLAKLTGSKLPEGYYADEKGMITTDPFQTRYLLPSGGHKGFAMATMVQVLSTTLSGMAFGPRTVPMYGAGAAAGKKRRLGQTYIVCRCDFCVPLEHFKSSLQQMTEEVRAQPAQQGETVMMPGDPEIHFTEHQREEGLLVDNGVWSELLKVADKYGVALPEPLTQ